MKRGDVVIVAFPYVDGTRGKNRPAVIVQDDRDNSRLSNTVLAMISGNTRHAGESTQVLIDPSDAAGASSGLHGPSVVKCCNLYTIRKSDVLQNIGHLSKEIPSAVNQALMRSLGLQ